MKIKQTVAATIGLGTLSVMVVTGPAIATGNAYTVAVGSDTASAAHPFTASSGSAVTWRVPTLAVPCSGASVPATPLSTISAGSAVTDVFSIAKVSFVGCSGPGGAMAVPTSGTWTFHADSVATASSDEVISGHIENVSFKLLNAACDVTVTGVASATFDEATQQLTIDESGFTGDLTVSDVKKTMLSKFKNGQPFDLHAKLNVASPDGAINLS